MILKRERERKVNRSFASKSHVSNLLLLENGKEVSETLAKDPTSFSA